MAVRVAINGFGRIGRAALRLASQPPLADTVEVVAVNDVADVELLAHLLRHDTVYGAFPGSVEVVGGDLVVLGRPLVTTALADPAALPWRDLEVDVALESTGRFRSRPDAAKHLEAGARRVVVSAPAKDPDATVLLGVNFDEVYDPERHRVLSMASCTTNCLAPVAKVLGEGVGIRHGTMTTIHAYTGDQRLVDAPHKDLRRARAAAANLVPTSTGAAKAIGLVLPELEGRLQGFAVRVPVLTGSLVDLTVETERTTSVAEVNELMRAAAESGPLAGILAYSEEPLVSSDVIGSTFSSVFDAGLTTVVGGTQVTIVSWYDNEWGYAARLVELAARVGAGLPAFV